MEEKKKIVVVARTEGIEIIVKAKKIPMIMNCYSRKLRPWNSP